MQLQFYLKTKSTVKFVSSDYTPFWSPRFWPHCLECGVLVPRYQGSNPGVKPHWKHGVLTAGPPGRSHRKSFFFPGHLLYSLFLSSYYIPYFSLFLLCSNIHLVMLHNQSERFCSGRHGEIGGRVNKKN